MLKTELQIFYLFAETRWVVLATFALCLLAALGGENEQLQDLDLFVRE